MHIKFTHGIMLGRDLEILLMYIQEEIDQSQPQVSNTYQFITLYYAWTLQWSDPIIILSRMHDLSPLLYKA